MYRRTVTDRGHSPAFSGRFSIFARPRQVPLVDPPGDLQPLRRQGEEAPLVHQFCPAFTLLQPPPPAASTRFRVVTLRSGRDARSLSLRSKLPRRPLLRASDFPAQAPGEQPPLHPPQPHREAPQRRPGGDGGGGVQPVPVREQQFHPLPGGRGATSPSPTTGWRSPSAFMSGTCCSPNGSSIWGCPGRWPPRTPAASSTT